MVNLFVGSDNWRGQRILDLRFEIWDLGPGTRCENQTAIDFTLQQPFFSLPHMFTEADLITVTKATLPITITSIQKIEEDGCKKKKVKKADVANKV